jgi:TolA-binding protein
MVRNLAQAEPFLKRKDRRGRIYFIIGQVYQELGFESEAYNYYKKCLATNPEYEVDFYARLYMAQVTEISRSRNVNAARKSFRKLLKDRKNKDFQDKIYYEMGMFELKQKNINQAIEDFNYSIRAGSNTRVDGESYLRLGQIYYDTLKNYEKSQAYYDSAISALPKDYDDYAKIKARQEILNEFVLHLKTIQWQDSLLSMATLDSVSLRGRIDSIFAEKKRLEDAEKAKKKKRGNRVEISSGNSNVFGSDGNTDITNENAEWYFGNPSAMSIGQSEFKRIWGNVTLEDNWRRSAKSISQNNTTTSTEAGEVTQAAAATDTKAAEANPADAEYAKLSKEIPRTEEQQKVSLKKIEDAYFALGDIYYFKLEEPSNARVTYLKLLERFPKTEYEPEVLYKLYLMHKTSNTSEAEQYANVLKQKHPNSTFTKILLNPDYLKESSEAAEKQKVLYADAYTHFSNGAYKEAQDVIAQANALGETSFTPNMKLLSILIIGETEDISSYQYALEEFIKENPDGALLKYAKGLLAASKQFALNQEKANGIGYVKSFAEPHYFVIVFKKEEKMSEPAAATLEKFNQQYFKEYKLKTSNLILNEEYAMTMVSELPGSSQAMEFRKTFNEKLSALTELRNHKFNSFVITKDNFNIFYRTKGLDEYLQFFNKNYPPANQ